MGNPLDGTSEDADVHKSHDRPDLRSMDGASSAVQKRIDAPVEADAHVQERRIGDLSALRSEGRRFLQHGLKRRAQLVGNVDRVGQVGGLAAARRAD